MIGLLIIATNKYIKFLEPLIKSADKYFLSDKEVIYYVFSDQEISIASSRNIVNIKIKHKEWPYMTLERYKLFTENSGLLKADYLFYCDVDMLFVNNIGDEILGDLVGTLHFGYIGTRGTPETNKLSKAFIDNSEAMQYYAGGFNGGTRLRFLKMSETLMLNINKDLEIGIIAIWHDESHLNRYFIDNKPTITLDPSYCYHEGSYKPYLPKLLALSKDHKIIRDE